MSSDVRVHVRLGHVRLDYQGAQAFYESKVESLVEAAAVHGSRHLASFATASSPVASNPSRGGPAAPERASDRAPVAAPAAKEAVPAPAVFAPRSPEFGRYIRRLGPEAGEPDRQVMALAFYLWNYERRETFGRPELLGCFQALSLPVPSDLEAILGDLTDRKRFLEPAGEGAWKLTKKGENYVKTRLLSV